MPRTDIQTQAGQSFGGLRSGDLGVDAMRCRVLGMDTRQRNDPLTLTIHAGVANTLGWVYLEQIE